MTYLDVQAPQRRLLPAFIAGFSLVLAGSMSVAGINLFGVRTGFGFVPLLVLAIWPRQANTLISLAFVFSAGLFTDWGTGGIYGQWALTFVLIWGFLRPELRSSPYSPLNLFLVWLATCGLALMVLSLTGYFVLEIYPDFVVLGRQMILATICLPAVMLLRRALAARFSDGEDWS